MIAPPLPISIVPPPRKTGRAPKITPQQAREIWTLYDNGERPSEIAKRYPVAASTVTHIGRGRDWGWATTDLRAKKALEAAMPVVDGQITTGYVLSERPVKAPAIVNTPEILAEAREFRRDLRARDLAVEMADAIAVLLEYREAPLPRFVTLDVAAIRSLVEQARSLP